jgi:hypothetical protein
MCCRLASGPLACLVSSVLFALPNCVFSADLSRVILPCFVGVLCGACGTHLAGEGQKQSR